MWSFLSKYYRGGELIGVCNTEFCICYRCHNSQFIFALFIFSRRILVIHICMQSKSIRHSIQQCSKAFPRCTVFPKAPINNNLTCACMKHRQFDVVILMQQQIMQHRTDTTNSLKKGYSNASVWPLLLDSLKCYLDTPFGWHKFTSSLPVTVRALQQCLHRQKVHLHL